MKACENIRAGNQLQGVHFIGVEPETQEGVYNVLMAHSQFRFVLPPVLSREMLSPTQHPASPPPARKAQVLGAPAEDFPAASPRVSSLS